MAYPPTPAGEEITEQMLQSIPPVFKVKEDINGRNNATLLADPDLWLDMPANSRWWVEFHLLVSGTQAAAIKTDWSVPTGVDGVRRILGPGTGATETSANNIAVRLGVHTFASAIGYGLPRNVEGNWQQIVETGLVICGSTAGQLALRWAQTTATTASPSFVKPGSIMLAFRTA